jgi:hypothetical protein
MMPEQCEAGKFVGSDGADSADKCIDVSACHGCSALFYLLEWS